MSKVPYCVLPAAAAVTALAVVLSPGDSAAHGRPSHLARHGAELHSTSPNHLPHAVILNDLSRQRDVEDRRDYTCMTGMIVQNLSEEHDAAIVMDYYPQAGGAPYSAYATSTAPGSAARIYAPDVSRLDHGIFACVANSDRPIGSIAWTNCPNAGRSAMYSHAEPSTEIIVPLVTKGYYNQCSLISIQNTDLSVPVDAEVALHAQGRSSPTATFTETILPGTSVTMDLCYEPKYAGVPEPFLGAAFVTAPAPVAVQSYIDIQHSHMAMYAFEGVPVWAADTELFAPLIRSRQPFHPAYPDAGYYDTGIAVVNPNDVDVDVTVEFFGAEGDPRACVGRTFTQGPVLIAANSMATFYQGPAAEPITGRHPLPDNCVASARITSLGGPVVAVVNDSFEFMKQSAAYNAIGARAAAPRVALPIYRVAHTEFDAYTGISAMNVGEQPADIELWVSSSDGASTPITQWGVGPMETALFWQGSFAEPAPGLGSAFVTSDQPLAVIVNDVPMNGEADIATYNGIPAEPAPARPWSTVIEDPL